MNTNTITEIMDQIGLEAAHEIGRDFGKDEFVPGWSAADLSRCIPCDPVDGHLCPELTARGWFPSYATEDEKIGQSPIDDQATVMLVCAAHIIDRLQVLTKVTVEELHRLRKAVEDLAAQTDGR